MILQKGAVEWNSFLENSVSDPNDEEATGELVKQVKAANSSNTHESSALKDDLEADVSSRTPDGEKLGALEKHDRRRELHKVAQNSTLFDELSISKDNAKWSAEGGFQHSANIRDQDNVDSLLPRSGSRTESVNPPTNLQVK